MLDLPFFPLFNFLRVVVRSGRVSPRALPNLLGWVVRLGVQEPARLADELLYGRRIRSQELGEDPIFILGHFRSGTTYLQDIFAADPRLAYLNLYQTYFPGMFLCTERVLKGAMARAVTRLNVRNAVHDRPLDFDSAGEEDIAMTMLGLSEAAYWGTLFPDRHSRYFGKYVGFDSPEDRESWERSYRWLLQKTSLAGGGRRLVLKSPPNTARISQLLSMFPRARFIYIHRNPYDVYGSTCKLWRINSKHGFQSISEDATKGIILACYERLVGAYLAQRAEIPAGQLAEVRCEELQQAPMQQMESLYRKLELGDFDSARPFLQQVVDARKGGSVEHYELSAQEIDTIQDRWGFALSEWPYPAPAV